MEDIIDKPKVFAEEKGEIKNENNDDDFDAPPSATQSLSNISSQSNNNINIDNNNNNQFYSQYNYTPQNNNEGLENVDDPNQYKLRSTPKSNYNQPNDYNIQVNNFNVINNNPPKNDINQQYYGTPQYQEEPNFTQNPNFEEYPHHPIQPPFPPNLANGSHEPMTKIPSSFHRPPHWPHHRFGPHFHEFHGRHDMHFWPHGPHDMMFWPHGPHDMHFEPHGPDDMHFRPHGPHDMHFGPHGPHGWHHHGPPHFHDFGPHFPH